MARVARLSGDHRCERNLIRWEIERVPERDQRPTVIVLGGWTTLEMASFTDK
jgi:hypothetical protein